MIETPEKLTVDEKLDLIEKSGWPIAYDGCHKIYFLRNEEALDSARSYDYDIFPATELREIFENSCSLRFVSTWGMEDEDWDHPWNIAQFEGVDYDPEEDEEED